MALNYLSEYAYNGTSKFNNTVMFQISLRIAVDALATHKLRTALTALGMSIGVGAVVTIVALGAGAKHTVSEDVRSAGTNLVRVDAGNFTRGGEESNIASGLGAATTLTVDDADAIGRIAGVKSYAAGVRLRGWVAAGTARVYTQVIGTDVAFPAMNGWSFARGRFFAASDVSAAAPVAVIGSIARDKLFGPDENPIGREIRIRDAMFRVSGIASGSDDDQMEMVFVPYTALQGVLGIGHLHSVTVAADPVSASDPMASNQALPTLAFYRHRQETLRGWPSLALVEEKRFALIESVNAGLRSVSSRTISNPSGVESLVLARLSPDDAPRTESWRILRRARRGSGSLARGLGSRGRRRVTLSGEEIAETRAYAESPVTSENGETCGRCDD